MANELDPRAEAPVEAPAEAPVPRSPAEVDVARPDARYQDDKTIPGMVISYDSKPAEPVAKAEGEVRDGPVTMATKKEPELGVVPSVFSAFNKAVLFLPDYGINRVMDVLEMSGVVAPQEDRRNARNYLERFFNAADYKTKEEVLNAFNLGIPAGGEKQPDPYGAAAGEGMALGAGFAGLVNRVAQLPRYVGPYGEEIGRRMLETLGNKDYGFFTRSKNFMDDLVRKTVDLHRKAPVATSAAEVTGGAMGNVATEAEKEYTPLRTASGEPIVTGVPALVTGGYTSALTESPLNTLKATVAGIPILSYQLARKGYTFVDGQIRQMTDSDVAKQKMSEAMRSAFERSTQKAEDKGILPRTREIEQAFEEEGVGAPQFSYAERTLDPLAAATQVILQGKAPEQTARDNIERFENNVQKAFNFFAKMIPDVGDSPLTVLSDRLRGMRQGIEETLTGTRAQAESDLQDLLKNFPMGNQSDRIERGRAIQAQIDEMKQTAKDRLLALADELKLNNPQLRAQLGDLKAGLLERFKPSSTTDDRLPAVIRDLRDLDVNTMNFQDYRRFREDIGSALGSAAAKGGRGKEITDLEIAKKMLDDWAENSFGPNYAQWRDKWMKEYVAPFENGLVYRLTERQFERPGMPVKYQLQGEMVADEIIKQAQRGKIDDFNQYIDLVQRDVPTMNNVRNAFLDDMLSKVYNPAKGEVNDVKLKQYVNDNAALLNKLGMQADVESIESASAALSQRLAGLKAREQEIKKDQLIKLMDASATKGQTTEAFVDDLLNSPSKLGTFYNRLKTPDEQGLVDEPLLDAFKGVVMNRVLSTMDQGPNAFADAMLKNVDVMKKIMTPKEFDKFMLVNDALYRAFYANSNMAGVGLIPPSLVQELEKAIGTKLPSLGSYARAMEANKQSSTFLVGLLAKNYLSARHNAAFEEIQRRAMFDKDFIDTLSTPLRADGSVPPDNERRLRAFMFEAMIPNGKDRRENVDVTYDPAIKGFRAIGSGEPTRAAPPPAPKDTGVPAFENRTEPVRPPVEVPPVAPVQLPQTPPEPATQMPPLTITPGPRTPPAAPPAAPATPGRQGGLMYQNMFPNDPLGALLAAKRTG